MDEFVNIAKKMILIKDMTDLLDFELIDQTFDKMEFRPNRMNSITVDLNMFDKPGFEKIKQALEKEATDYIINAHSFQLGKHFSGIKITNSWGNATEPGQEHHEHTHPFSVVSGVLFLDDNPDNLNLMLETYLPTVPHHTPIKSSHISLKALISGTNLFKHLVLFLSNTGHRVQPTRSPGPVRRTMSFDTFWTGAVGDLESNSNLDKTIF
jgi:hypothetical protein